MSFHRCPSPFSFVWQKSDLNNEILNTCKENEPRIIIDFSHEPALELLNFEGIAPGIDIKLSIDQFLDPKLKNFNKKGRVGAIWLEYFPSLLTCDNETFTQRLDSFSFVNIITGDIDFITSCFANKRKNCGIALKGSESSGFVGSETLLSLVCLAEKLAELYSFQPPVHVWGGVGTPEAAAALLLSGIQSIVFESLHWLTKDFTQKYPLAAEKLSQLRVEHTGLNRISQQLNYRSFDKGNNKAFASLTASQTDDEIARLPKIIDEISSSSVYPLQSRFQNTQLIPMGIETAFARLFRQRFGEDFKTAVQHFSKDVDRLLKAAPRMLSEFFSGTVTSELGIRYPFIQGGMACITDVPEFALSIARAGGLPTIAFGMQPIKLIEDKFSNLHNVMQGFSYAINVIALPENPFRDAQLSWILQNPPSFVVISAGDPSFALQFQEHNIPVIFVTSDIDLLQLAWQRGIKYVVCEGHEAGGHIGELSLLTLAQAVQEIKYNVLSNKNDDRQRRLILAGGIFNRMSLLRSVLLGADAVQMGTVYLATREIVANGALGKLYQKMIVDSAVGDTVITGASVGLRIRSLVSPKIKKLLQIEKDHTSHQTDDPSLRYTIEKESGGSLYKAARGLDPSTGNQLSDEKCLEEGQFMSGAVAGVISKVDTVGDFHAQLANEEITPLLRRERGEIKNLADVDSQNEKDRIAITGMAVVNALGQSPEEVWDACLQMKSGIQNVPISRWDHSKYYLRSSNPKGKTYCGTGAFVSLEITRKDLGVSPHDFKTMTDSTKLTMWLAEKVIQDSNILSSSIPRNRIAVIVSQNSGEMGSTAEDLTLYVVADQLAHSIQEYLSLTPQQVKEVEGIIKAGRIVIDDTTLLGRLNCTAGGFICNKYGFTGPSYSVSAACATGLVALYSAIQLMQNDVIDAALVGGGEELLHPASYLEFSALGALAGKTFATDDPAATSRPFDRDRDGMVLGEGGAMIVIERESSARKRQKDIYACITGMGASNNHKGMVESVAETQQLAISASFRDTPYGPEQVDMIECHATATPTGDIEEIKALKAVYPRGNTVVLSSFKSQIGHTLGTSGLNSMIRGICALRSGVYPPTLNYNSVDPQIDLESWGFHVCKQPEVWPWNTGRPRRFQVNAFGFGGSNYVVQLEEANWSSEQIAPHPAELPAMLSGVSLELLGIKGFRMNNNGKEYRVGSIHKDMDSKHIFNILTNTEDSDITSISLQKRLASEGLFLSPTDSSCPLAFIFAGQGTHYSRMGLELYENFPTIRHWMDKIAELADFDILHMLFHEEEANLRRTLWQQPAIFVLEYAIFQQLKECDIHPVALAGHSMGELTALAAADCFSYEDAFRIISVRAQCMEKASKSTDDPGTMIAVDVPEDILQELMQGKENLFYTNFNSDHQVVVGGSSKQIEELKQKLDDLKYWSHLLPVSMAFHSPLMRVIRDDLGDYLAGIHFQPPRIPVISNTTRHPYPPQPEKMREIILSHLECPVHWKDNVSTLWNDFGARFFVEIGPQDTLCKLLPDIIPEAMGMNTCYPKQEVLSLRKTMSTLLANGHIVSNQPLPSLDGYTSSDKQARKSGPRDQTLINEIIQREINLFALDGVERFLKPAIVKAIKQEVDPSFKNHELNAYLASGTPRTATITGSILSANTFNTAGTVESKSPSSRSSNDPIVEQVIEIIMEATGYERSELEPDMDIRQDLSIRSSRLPIIMDAAEQIFNIEIKLEEFMDVRTIRDFAKRISEIIEEQETVPAQHVPKRLKDSRSVDQKEKSSSIDPAFPIQRRIFCRQEVSCDNNTTSLLPKDGHVLILTLGADGYASDVEKIFSQDGNSSVTTLKISSAIDQPGHINLIAPEKAQEQIKELASRQPLSGIVLITNVHDESALPFTEVSPFCTGFFAVVQILLKSNQRRFCFHLSQEAGPNPAADMLKEGILGIFLSAKIEYQSVLFRSIQDGIKAGAAKGIKLAFDEGILPIELVYDKTKIYTHALSSEILPYKEQKSLRIGPQDVVLISGGARGITSSIARSLAALGCKTVLLGRSDLASADDSGQASIEKAGKTGHEIETTLQKMRTAGAEVEYIRCDVTDQACVQRSLADITSRYGRIDGIVHGAGILRDSFIQLQNIHDFNRVITTKVSGIINLVKACGHNLRFVVGLSSIAAITGNAGQANYCCANRAMASFISSLYSRDSQIVAKTFWLPPIEGLGMAEDPDLKEILKARVGENAFLHVEELPQLIIKELLFGPAEQCWVAPARQLPVVSSVVISNSNSSQIHDWFDCSPFPLIDRVLSTDLREICFEAERVYSQTWDLWLKDHKPFQWLSHPIISAIIIIETFLETASLFFPARPINHVEKVNFSRMLECPDKHETNVKILCHAEKNRDGDTICTITIGKKAVQAKPDAQQQQNMYYNGRVILSADGKTQDMEKVDIARLLEDSGSVMNKKDILKYYSKHSGLTGRYQVLEHILNYSQRSILGEMIYPETKDFLPPRNGSYRYPAYVLEALMQLVTFHIGIREQQEQRAMVPAAIDSLTIFQNCMPREKIYLQGNLLESNDTGTVWEAMGCKSDGEAVMLVRGLKMNWLD